MKASLFYSAASRPSSRKLLLVNVAVFLFILLFGYAAFSKLITFQQFREQLGQSPFIGSYNGLLAGLIPALELLICLLLIFPLSRLAGVLAFTVMMAGFTTYIGLMLAFGVELPCICGGVISGFSWGDHLIFNSFFLVWGVVLLMFCKSELHP